MKVKKYRYFSEAKKATNLLGITSQLEYSKRYKEDPRLPSNPYNFYAKEVSSKNIFTLLFGGEIKEFYPNFAEARQAVMLLNFTSEGEYRKRYKEDPKLPSNPHIIYSSEWPTKKGWPIFLGKKVRDLYSTFIEACKATKALEITSQKEYQKRYKEDPRLPSNPRQTYIKENIKNLWSQLLGQVVKEYYSTFDEAQEAVINLGITTTTEYKLRYKEDQKLPAEPSRFYREEWLIKCQKFDFFGKEIKKYYDTFIEAQKAVITLGISNHGEYKLRYKEDPRLPPSPNAQYADEWPDKNGADIFFGRVPKNHYTTLEEAVEAIERLGITSQEEYLIRYKEDPRLPFNLKKVYEGKWPTKNGKSIFFRPPSQRYATLAEAKKGIILLGITSSQEYSQRYKEDPLLPSDIRGHYPEDSKSLRSLVDIYIADKIDSFKVLTQAVKALKVKDSKEYRLLRQKYPQLPSNPKRSFPDDFIDWYELCNIPKPYDYLDLKRLVQESNIETIKGYHKWRKANKDPRIPSNPHQAPCYKGDWLNWHSFFGLEEPYQPKYIYAPYLAWRDEIISFMKLARGGGSKTLLLCKFVRQYIQKYQLSKAPVDFAVNKNINIRKFREFISQSSNPTKSYNVVDEFIDYIIRTKCSDEDPDTGEIIRILDAKNRIKGVCLPDVTFRPSPDETVKPALSYQYVQAIRNWTMPSDAKTFADLTHLHNFQADWIRVPRNIIDENDPDCVFKVIDDKYAKIWNPIHWMHAYTLFSVPLRGIQIAYNDSGEGDSYIPEFKNNKIIWVENTGKLAGLTENQSMIKRYPNDEFGMCSTSNKTSINTGSQSVPWMPIELAYWLIKLRKWQSKYNPIDYSKAWLDCERTNLNEVQRKQKGSNCFLFRDFGEEECGTFGGRLAQRLAAALYYSQPSGVVLATCEGSLSALSNYKSEFTPHSMRVSLITIYVMEYNLDLSIIMKIAGHSSIIMSVYYVKIQGTALRRKVEEGEKLALKSQATATQSMIEQLRVDEIKPNLIGNSEETLKALNNSTPAGNYLFRDWGLCPHAGTRCEDGGEFIGQTKARSSVPTGYLGGENCIRCRHFITGPAFIGGLLALFQEIILNLENKQAHYDELIQDEEKLEAALEKENEKEYICNKGNKTFDERMRFEISTSIRKTTAEYEVVAKKMDVLYCDLGAVSTLIHQCQALLNKSNSIDNSDDDNLQLIVKPDHELQVIAEEVSQYELLCEVCENAEIYQSASAELAITPRTQLIDNMMLRNNLKPLLFTLTNKQQLQAGNQLNKLFKERLKSHVKVNDLIEGKLLLSDLEEHERIEPVDLLNVLHQQRIDIKEI